MRWNILNSLGCSAPRGAQTVLVWIVRPGPPSLRGLCHLLSASGDDIAGRPLNRLNRVREAIIATSAETPLRNNAPLTVSRNDLDTGVTNGIRLTIYLGGFTCFKRVDPGNH